MSETRQPQRPRKVPPAEERYRDSGRREAQFKRERGDFAVSCHCEAMSGSQRAANYPATHRFTMTAFAPIKGERFTVDGQEFEIIGSYDPRVALGPVAGDLRGSAREDAGKFTVVLAAAI